MIKKLKLGLLSLAVLSFVFAGANTASASTVTYTADATVDLSSPDINLTILGTSFNSVATSVVAGTGTLTVTVPSGSTFKVTSASRALTSDTTSTSSFIISQSCGVGNIETTTIAGVSTSGTVVLTPAPSACIYSSGGGGGGGGGSSSASTTATVAQSPTPVAVVVSPTVTMVTDTPGCSGGNKYNTSTGALCVNNAVSTPASGAAASSTASSSGTGTYNLGATTLKNGSKGDSVKDLQKVLNKLLSTNLVVDGKLGPKTIAVIKKWQKDHGLVADGLVGKKTKAAMLAEAAK